MEFGETAALSLVPSPFWETDDGKKNRTGQIRAIPKVRRTRLVHETPAAAS